MKYVSVTEFAAKHGISERTVRNYCTTGKIDGVMEVAEPRYAVVTSYNNAEDFTFEAGKIYRITSVEITDEAISGNDEGNVIAVNVNVEVADWTIVDTSVQF